MSTNLTDDDRRVIDLAMQAASTAGSPLNVQIDNACVALIACNARLNKLGNGNYSAPAALTEAMAMVESAIQGERTTVSASQPIDEARLERGRSLVRYYRNADGRMTDDDVDRAARQLVEQDPALRALSIKPGRKATAYDEAVTILVAAGART